MVGLAFLAGWCGNEPRRFPPRPKGPGDPPWWGWLVISVFAGLAGIAGSNLVANVIGGTLTEPVTVLANMAGAFLAGRALSGAVGAFLGAGAGNSRQIG
jgi:hypothetical protein